MGEQLLQIFDDEFQQMIDDAVKRDRESYATLPMATRQKMFDPEGVKRSGEQSSNQAKFVKFDQAAGD